jgi:hypothetical protein
MRVLLVEPKYYTQYPPLGLLKLSSLYKKQGHEVRFVRDKALITDFRPDRIDVTSLFTWAWRPVWDCIEFYRSLFPKAHIRLGGIYASLTPDHARRSGADEVISGLIKEAEDLLPDYSLVPEWHTTRQASVLFSHRGCIRSCGFCAVPKLEGKPFQIRVKKTVKHLIDPQHKRVVLWDNNILGEPNWKDVIDELREMNVEIDFNQGLDARLIDLQVASALKGIKMPAIRIAYDFPGVGKYVKRAIELLEAVGFRRRKIVSYVLFNYKDTPEDLFTRVRDLLQWGASAYPMRYQPLSGPEAFEKDSYISPAWSKRHLEMVADARRVIGFGGAFPPYEGLRKKFDAASNFDEAFGLREKKPKPKEEVFAEPDANLLEMGNDHQFPTHGISALKKKQTIST